MFWNVSLVVTLSCVSSKLHCITYTTNISWNDKQNLRFRLSVMVCSSLFLAQKAGLGRLTVVVSRSHTDKPHSIEFLWTSDRSVAEATHTRDRHLCPRWDSNPQSLQASGRRPKPQGRYTPSVKLNDCTVWRHTWRKNWVNWGVLTPNSEGFRSVLSSRLSHRELRSSLRAIPQFPQFTCRHHDGIISRHIRF